jgi:hypothetical protein
VRREWRLLLPCGYLYLGFLGASKLQALGFLGSRWKPRINLRNKGVGRWAKQALTCLRRKVLNMKVPGFSDRNLRVTVGRRVVPDVIGGGTW